jgi:phthiocerol/phenolphthiocerol synthesis type-I polyketide synthase E
VGEARERFAHPERVLSRPSSGTAKPATIFLFPGQGALEKDATSELYEHEPRFRSALDECADILRQYTGEDLRDWLYARRNKDSIAGDLQMEQTAIMQPLLFAVEYALARFWESFGIRPVAMLGHSLGEYVAACIAGVFSLPEALSLVAVRGRLVQSVKPGQMLAVSCGEAQLGAYLEGSGCSLAAVNSQAQCVASGPGAEMDTLQARLKAAGISSRRLRTSHAFHSEMLQPILETFEKCVAEVEMRPPSLPFVSNVSGTWIKEAEAMSPAYWARHLRATVRFGDGLQQLLGLKDAVFLEVGPGRVLTTLVKQAHRSAPAISSLASERNPQQERRGFLEAIGQLWLNGAEIDWMPLHDGEQPRRVPLPAYVFDRKRYWIEREVRLGSMPAKAAQVDVPEIQVEIRTLNVPAALRETGKAADANSGMEAQAPQHQLEVRLVEIWKSYLGTQDIGVRQSFFEMGGDSLLAARLHSQLRREYEIDLPLAMMLELETIRNVALYITISRNPKLIDSLSEEDVDNVLSVMESWFSQRNPGVAEGAVRN